MRKISCGLAVLMIMAGSLVWAAPVKIVENFDQVELGKAPAGWKVTGEAQTTVTVVDKSVFEALSAPHCLKLTDDSDTSAPAISREIGQQPKGVLRFAVNVPTAGAGDFYATLNTGEERVADVQFSISANLKYRDKDKKLQNIAKYAQSAWHQVEIAWNSQAGTYSLNVDGKKFGDYLFMVNTTPDTVVFKVGSSQAGKVGQNAFLDNVEIVTE